MGDASEQRDLSGLPVVCPVCHHERCAFTAGSVYRTRPGCRNPHHRQPPIAFKPPEENGTDSAPRPGTRNFHGADAEDVSAIVARVNREDA